MFQHSANPSLVYFCIHPWWFVCLRSSLDHILAERQKCYGQFSAKKKNRSRTGILKMFRLLRTWKGISVVWAFRVEMLAKTKNARTLKQNCVSAWNLRSDLSKLFNLARLIFRGSNSVRQIYTNFTANCGKFQWSESKTKCLCVPSPKSKRKKSR